MPKLMGLLMILSHAAQTASHTLGDELAPLPYSTSQVRQRHISLPAQDVLRYCRGNYM